MMEKKLMVMLIDGKYAAVMDTGREKGDKTIFGLLRSFDYPVDAINYVAGVVDGWRLAHSDGGYFVPFDSDNVRVSPEVGAVLNALIRSVEDSSGILQ
ncbi:MAG: hypothetical protein ABFD50_05175 [Smithella sp.]